jgi:sugar lactone lactonase YvrE
MRTASAVLLTVLGSVWALGCGSNGASGPVVSVSPLTLTVTTGGGATTFQANLSNGAVDPVTWTFTGPGTISTTTGDQTSYQPPPLGGAGGTATLRATAGCGAGCVPVGDTATITVNTATTGTLTITVQLQGAGPANLTVTGPNGFSQPVSTSSTATLTALAPGTYMVTAADIVVSDPIVTSQYSAPVVSVPVVANAAATATVSYAPKPGYGLLWTVGAAADTLDGFSSNDLRATKSPSITPGTGGTVQGIAFDATGSMWAALKGATDSVVSYAATDLAAGSAALSPVVTITGSKIADPSGVAIGPNDWIWVASCGTTSVTAYALTDGSQQVTIGSTGFNCPRGIAFDTAGNLWVANASGSAVRILRANISATNPTAVVDTTLSAPSGASQPYGIALDAEGNVWVSYCMGSAVSRYTASGTSVATTPAATLTSNGLSPPGLDCPVALALDNSGLLWVANKGTGNNGATLCQFAASDMAAGGAANPVTEVPGIGITVGGLAFNPTSTGLPINH